MKFFATALVGLALLAMNPVADAVAQEAGDYQSAATGVWSDAATWSTYDGANWVAATSAPDGSETITVTANHTVTTDIAVSVSGYVTVESEAELAVDAGSLTFTDGSTYEHARDGGSVPSSMWGDGSTALFTGTATSAPANRGQNYHHLVLNTPDQLSNLNLAFDGHTVSGDIHVISTGSARWQLFGGSSATVTILGDVIIDDGQFAAQGTGSATDVIIDHHGDVIVTGGNFSIARGSQGGGTGSTTWILHDGDLSMANATTQNSNPVAGQAKFVFAADGSQQLSFNNVNYAGGGFHFDVEATSELSIADGFVANGLVVNRGAITVTGGMTFDNGAVYDHARDGGSVPSAVWAEGSTAKFTGTTSDAPGNRGQDYYHLVLDTPDLSANRDLSLDGNTISGDIHVISTGSGRWQLVGGSSGTVTIMGDVVMEAGQFATQGTGSLTHVVVDHYGDIIVTGGNFAIARGSQASGEGTTRWYLHEGNFSMANATTQNSNRPGATFVFAGDGEQELELSNVSYGGGGFPITVAEGAVLMVTGDPIEGNGEFTVEDDGALATAHPDGIDGAVQTDGIVTFEPQAGLWFVGSDAQVFGASMPDSVGVLVIANPVGVTASDTTHAVHLVVEAGAQLNLEDTGSLSVDGGSVEGLIVNEGELVAENAIEFGAESVYEHARNGGSVPSGIWAAGSTALFTGIETDAPDNRGQDYHHLVLNTPDLLSNRDLSLDGNTIGGDIHVITTGLARWQLVGGSSGTVTIMGDVIVEDGQFASQGTGSLTHVVIDHFGDIIVTGGNFAISRGSQGGGEGTTRWYLHEGDFYMANATTQNSNRPGATFVFAAEGEQILHLDDVSYGGGGLPLLVEDGSILLVPGAPIEGNGEFIVEAGGTLGSVHAEGVAGTVQTEGDVIFDEVSSFIFHGDEAQITSELMPTVVQDLTINNDAGVTLTQETTINGVLRLQAGVFDNTIPFNLGPEGSISYEGGSLLNPVSGETAGVPVEFHLHQNYPNPFAGNTTIQYDIRESVPVSITVYDLVGRRVVQLVDDVHAPGTYTVEWNASGLSSGVYLYRINAGDFTAVRRVTLMQ